MVNILMAANGLLLIIGGFKYPPRMVGMFCHYLLTLFLVASVTVTYKYRYSTMGKMAALSTMSVTNMTSLNITLYGMTNPTTKQEDLYVYPSDRTYMDDAKFIDNMFVFQLIALIVCFITANLGCFKVCNNNDLRDSQLKSSSVAVPE